MYFTPNECSLLSRSGQAVRYKCVNGDLCDEVMFKVLDSSCESASFDSTSSRLAVCGDGGQVRTMSTSTWTEDTGAR